MKDFSKQQFLDKEFPELFEDSVEEQEQLKEKAVAELEFSISADVRRLVELKGEQHVINFLHHISL